MNNHCITNDKMVKMLEILSKILEIDIDILLKTPATTKLSELGISSIQFIQYIVALEEEFNIEISDDDLIMSSFETIESACNTLNKYFAPNTPVKKVLICDCDNVFWHGIAGEENLSLDVATRGFHNLIKDLYNNGVIICLCSKNTYDNIITAFQSLNISIDIGKMAITKINFLDKATNIKSISSELNLSTDSFVFVDDSKYELDLVSNFIPDISTVHADFSNLDFINKIRSYFSSEPSEINRTQQYIAQKKREKDKLHVKTIEEFNNSLNTVAECRISRALDASRIAELTQRTNQFNLSAFRYTTDEICNFINSDDYIVYSLSVSDKYGDMGIIGAAIVYKSDPALIIGFYISCRAFDRHFENKLLDYIKNNLKTQISGVYNKNNKNIRFNSFYSDNNISIVPCNNIIYKL